MFSDFEMARADQAEYRPTGTNQDRIRFPTLHNPITNSVKSVGEEHNIYTHILHRHS